MGEVGSHQARRSLAEPGAQALTGLVLVIDPGHGGPDRGREDPGWPAEADWALDVAQRLRNRCQAQGASVFLTRAADAFVPQESRRVRALERQPHVILSLHLGRPLCGTAATAELRARPLHRGEGALARDLQAGLLEAAPVRATSGRPGPAECAGLEAGWAAAAVVLVAHAPLEAAWATAMASPELWARGLARGLVAYWGARATRRAEPATRRGASLPAVEALADAAAPPPMEGARALETPPPDAQPKRQGVERPEGPETASTDPLAAPAGPADGGTWPACAPRPEPLPTVSALGAARSPLAEPSAAAPTTEMVAAEPPLASAAPGFVPLPVRDPALARSRGAPPRPTASSAQRNTAPVRGLPFPFPPRRLGGFDMQGTSSGRIGAQPLSAWYRPLLGPGTFVVDIPESGAARGQGARWTQGGNLVPSVAAVQSGQHLKPMVGGISTRPG